jgi:hypothetical protein
LSGASHLETENGIVLTRQETLVALHMLRCNLQV